MTPTGIPFCRVLLREKRLSRAAFTGIPLLGFGSLVGECRYHENLPDGPN